MALQYTIKAIPTDFDGRRYRSRLEAKWACFFTLLGWKFEYEPLDFGTWSPDFVLFGKDGAQIFVEVKPISEFDAVIGEKIVKALPEGREALLVGLAPFDIKHGGCDEIAIGWLTDWYEGRHSTDRWWWERAPLTWYRAKPDFADFTHEQGSFHGRLTGEHDGGGWGGAPSRVDEIKQLWNEASNRTQYMRYGVRAKGG